MQIPAGCPTGISRKVDRRRAASPGGPSRTCTTIKIYRANRRKTNLWAATTGARARLAASARPDLEFGFGRVLRGGHQAAGDLAHMFSGIGELTLQELRLDAHGFLKVGRVNQFSRVLERGLDILFGERQRLFGHLRSRSRDR